MSEGMQVRPAGPEDLEAMATILVEGFRSKFEAAFRKRMDRAERIVARTLALEVPQGLPGLFVVELGGQVVGTLALRRQGQPEVPVLPTMAILFEELGLWSGLRAMFYLSLLDQPFKRHEVYVSDVAVAGPFRRRGAGQALLLHAEEVARQWGKRALVLDVNASNKGARRLYHRLGYEDERMRRSLLTQWLLGTAEWARMRKDLQ